MLRHIYKIRYVCFVLFIQICLLQIIQGQRVTVPWDDTLDTRWPAECRVVEIRSSADGSVQRARFYSSESVVSAPLIVSLHTWSGDYNQQDPIAGEAIRRGWNYIHPDFRGPNVRPEAGGSELVITDIRDAIDFALGNSNTDPDDVHIIGVSGGGYAALVAYMRLDYPVRSFNAWAAISDLNSWYKECRSRSLKYAADIENITTGGSGYDPEEGQRRSPLFMEYKPEKRKKAVLNLYAGINDGYAGSVPVIHSIEFYNRIVALRHPDTPGLAVNDSTVISILARRYNPSGKYEKRMAGRNVYLSAGERDVRLHIFEGGHEMLVPHALSLIPVKDKSCNPDFKGTILVIGDSNAAGENSWPEYLGIDLPYATVVNVSTPGNTIGFDNLGRHGLNTLRNINEYLKEFINASSGSGERLTTVIALGTNDTKHIFRNSQKEVPGNLGLLISKIQGSLPGTDIYIAGPPPVDESKDITGKYKGSGRRIRELHGAFKKVARETGVKFLDLYSLLEEGFDERTSDGVHFDDVTGYEVASYIASVISPGEKCAGQKQGSTFDHNPDTNTVIPPAWAFGVLYGGYTDQAGTIDRIKAIQAHDYPVDAYWIDSWFWSFRDMGAGPAGYLNFCGDTIAFPDRHAMWSWMEQNNIKGGFWIWDCILETGNETIFREFLDNGFFADVYLNKNSWHNKGTTTAMFNEDKKHKGTLCGEVDFDNQQAVKHFGNRLKPLFQEGADFIKLDRTDHTGVCRAMYEYTAHLGGESKGRGFILSHSGGTDSEEYKRYPVKWTDDTRSDWTVRSPLVMFDPWVPEVALKENIAMYTDPASATSSIPFLTNDLGGFDMGHTDKPDEELYLRWMQFSMFCPVTEVFSQPENPTSNLAWEYSTSADSLFREYSHRRMRLFPYLYSYAHLSRLIGINMIRPLQGHLYEYMLGSELLIAPVYEKGSRSRSIELPEGGWIDYWTGDRLDGGMKHIVAAPYGQIPLLVREGSIIPERPYASSIEKGSNDTITLNVYPGADCSFSLIEDDGVSNDYMKGGFATTEITGKLNSKGMDITIWPVHGNFKGMSARRHWEMSIHYKSKPRAIMVNGITRPFEFFPDRKETIFTIGSYDKTKETAISIILQ